MARPRAHASRLQLLRYLRQRPPQDQSVSIDMTGMMTATTDPIFLGGNATNISNANQTVGKGLVCWSVYGVWEGVNAKCAFTTLSLLALCVPVSGQLNLLA